MTSLLLQPIPELLIRLGLLPPQSHRDSSDTDGENAQQPVHLSLPVVGEAEMIRVVEATAPACELVSPFPVLADLTPRRMATVLDPDAVDEQVQINSQAEVVAPALKMGRVAVPIPGVRVSYVAFGEGELPGAMGVDEAEEFPEGTDEGPLLLTE